MYKILNFSRLIVFAASVIFAFQSCKKDDEPRTWVVSYTNVTIVDQFNLAGGHFFQPTTGKSVNVNNTEGISNSLALMFFSESGGRNTFLTFPANGQTASTQGTAQFIQFTNNPGGINFWPQGSLISGMVFQPASATVDQFEALLADNSWRKFNDFFGNNNANSENLEFKNSWVLNPSSAKVYLLQFDGMVRAILCVRNVVPSSASGGSIRFDIIVEGREIWQNNNRAGHLQPLVPL